MQALTVREGSAPAECPAEAPVDASTESGDDPTVLVAGMQAGRADAFEAVMRRHNRLLYRLARGILGSDSEAQEIVQEAYLRAFLSLSQLRDPGGLTPWLLRIARNEALGRLRRRQTIAEFEAMSRSSPEQAQHAVPTLGGSPPEDPEAAAARAELRGRIEAAVDALPAPFRAVFLLRAVEQLGVEDTANTLGIPRETVKTRFLRARQKLRDSLGDGARELVADSFPFAGAQCDVIVAIVLAELQAAGLLTGPPTDPASPP